MNLQPVIFGEVLYDIFSDGRKILGGAPFNVASYLRGFGVNPIFISSVGNDVNGSEIIDSMKSIGMDSECLNILEDYPTGHALIHKKDGDQTFELPENVAYDYINLDQDKIDGIKSKEPPLLYHGSLALRSKTSLDTLHALCNDLGLPVFVDINLRSPWYTEEIIKECLLNGRWVKLNNNELFEITGSNRAADSDNIKEMARELLQKYDIDLLVVTLGGEGVIAMEKGKISIQLAPEIPGKLEDTVGAGDAFSAVTILGIINNWNLGTTVRRAMQFASGICQVKGAFPADQTIYETLRDQWEQENEFQQQ